MLQIVIPKKHAHKSKPLVVGLKRVLIASSFFAASGVFAADYYEVIDLGKFEGGIAPTAGFAIDPNDIAVGYSVREENIEVTNQNGTVSVTPTQFARGLKFDSNTLALTDLGALDNTEVLVELTNLNDNGEQETVTIDLGIPYTPSLAVDVNDSGIAVGYSARVFGTVVTSGTEDNPVETAATEIVEKAVIFDSGAVIAVPDFDPEKSLEMRALGINGDLVVGYARYDDPDDVDDNGDPLTNNYQNGFIFNIASQELTRVATLGAGLQLSLRDINANGFAVGTANQIVDERFYNQVVGVDYNANNIAEVIEIFGEVSQQAWAINDQGIIVGQALNQDRVFTAFSYDLNSKVAVDLGVLNQSFAASVAYDINDNGQIVGSSQVQNSPVVYHAILHENGELKDLDKLIGCDTGWRLDEARGINDNGVIVGKGVKDGEIRGFMLKPLAGVAPVCEEEKDSGSGSLPMVSLLVLMLLGFRRSKS